MSLSDTDAFCTKCGKVYRGLPDAKTAGIVLEAHLKVCKVPASAADLVKGIEAGVYDDVIETLLSALHTRKRVRRGDISVALR